MVSLQKQGIQASGVAKTRAGETMSRDLKNTRTAKVRSLDTKTSGMSLAKDLSKLVPTIVKAKTDLHDDVIRTVSTDALVQYTKESNAIRVQDASTVDKRNAQENLAIRYAESLKTNSNLDFNNPRTNELVNKYFDNPMIETTSKLLTGYDLQIQDENYKKIAVNYSDTINTIPEQATETLALDMNKTRIAGDRVSKGEVISELLDVKKNALGQRANTNTLTEKSILESYSSWITGIDENGNYVFKKNSEGEEIIDHGTKLRIESDIISAVGTVMANNKRAETANNKVIEETLKSMTSVLGWVDVTRFNAEMAKAPEWMQIKYADIRRDGVMKDYQIGNMETREIINNPFTTMPLTDVGDKETKQYVQNRIRASLYNYFQSGDPQAMDNIVNAAIMTDNKDFITKRIISDFNSSADPIAYIQQSKALFRNKNMVAALSAKMDDGDKNDFAVLGSFAYLPDNAPLPDEKQLQLMRGIGTTKEMRTDMALKENEYLAFEFLVDEHMKAAYIKAAQGYKYAGMGYGVQALIDSARTTARQLKVKVAIVDTDTGIRTKTPGIKSKEVDVNLLRDMKVNTIAVDEYLKKHDRYSNDPDAFYLDVINMFPSNKDLMIKNGIAIGGSIDNLQIYVDMDKSEKNHYMLVGEGINFGSFNNYIISPSNTPLRRE